MRGIDPRLVRRARGVRALLAADAALGVLAALLVLAQAVLLARVAARGFGGASLADVALPLGLLVAVVGARAAAAYGFEVVGRRAAVNVLSELRLELVERRLRGQPAALDGAESAEVSTAAVGGVDALETTFARYLPQVVLAVTVPVAVLVLVASIDLVSAGGDAAHAAARPRVHVAGRALHRAACPRTVAGARTALDTLPRLGARAAHAPGVQPRRDSGGADRRGERPLPPRDDGRR